MEKNVNAAKVKLANYLKEQQKVRKSNQPSSTFTSKDVMQQMGCAKNKALDSIRDMISNGLVSICKWDDVDLLGRKLVRKGYMFIK